MKAGICFSCTDVIIADGRGSGIAETSGKCLKWIGRKHDATPQHAGLLGTVESASLGALNF